MEIKHQVFCADCLDWMKVRFDDSVDLEVTSPPYEDARRYAELGFSLTGQDWVDWIVKVIHETLRICSGLVVFVVEGRTHNFRWSATPALLMADLHRAGVCLRKPPIFHRVGVPGSGGPDWLRNDYEFIVCCTSESGKLKWSDNCAMGHTPKYLPGGKMSHRMPNGRRVDKLHTKNDGNGMIVQGYNAPKIANPGNVIHCNVGGGRMGSKLAHENEAPFPESLVEFFVRSFCPVGGIVYDPFCGSGTTAAVCERWDRLFVGTDVRRSQVDLTKKRIAESVLQSSSTLGVHLL